MELSKKSLDDYEAIFTDQADFIAEVEDMEENSEWISGVPSNGLQLEAILPLEVFETAPKYNLDTALTMDTAESGTQLILDIGGQKMLVRKCAKDSLTETAKLFGSALGRMTANVYSETLNNGFSVARGNSKILQRYGKISSCHSDGDSGYAVMPIPDLVKITQAVLRNKFGEMDFQYGYNSHSFTEAVWHLPEAQNKLLTLYQDALDSVHSQSSYAINFMPAVRFISSDTSNSCATLQPMFELETSRYIHFCDGIKVKHSAKPTGKYGLELYEESIAEIFAKFDESIEQIKKLATIDILYPENTVIGLCKKFGIAKKYGEAAREEVVHMLGYGTVSAHDVYLAMTAVLQDAATKNVSKIIYNNLDEALSKIAMLQDWSEFDVGGVVAWKD